MMFPLFRLCAQNILAKEIGSMTQPLACTLQNKLHLDSFTTVMRKQVRRSSFAVGAQAISVVPGGGEPVEGISSTQSAPD